jgi:3-deoxy-manno-octulosonate cytidylyltransferase (CMP-KDO synthetase)
MAPGDSSADAVAGTLARVRIEARCPCQPTLHPEFIVAIPARYGSTRLPAKPLRDHRRRADGGAGGAARAAGWREPGGGGGGRSTHRRCTGRAGRGYLHDAQRHASGSDRLAECAAHYGWADDAIVVNLQGDEPFAPARGHSRSGARAGRRRRADGDAGHPITDAYELFDPNVVKLVRASNGRALYFSRAPLAVGTRCLRDRS